MVQRLAAVLLLAAAAACGAAAPAAAAPCTNTYIGPRWGGESGDPANWSRHVLPGPADHVCFPAGFRVDVGGGVHAFRSISGVRTLVITGGSLLLTDPQVSTTVTNLVIYADGVCSPTLGGAATVNVRSLLLWGRDGAMIGPGRTVLGPASRTTVNPGPWRSVYLLGRDLDNYGDLTWAQGSMRVTSTITNFGMMRVNSETGALTGYDDTFGLAHGKPYLWSRFRPCVVPVPRVSAAHPPRGVLL